MGKEEEAKRMTISVGRPGVPDTGKQSWFEVIKDLQAPHLSARV